MSGFVGFERASGDVALLGGFPFLGGEHTGGGGIVADLRNPLLEALVR